MSACIVFETPNEDSLYDWSLVGGEEEAEIQQPDTTSVEGNAEAPRQTRLEEEEDKGMDKKGGKKHHVRSVVFAPSPSTVKKKTKTSSSRHEPTSSSSSSSHGRCTTPSRSSRGKRMHITAIDSGAGHTTRETVRKTGVTISQVATIALTVDPLSILVAEDQLRARTVPRSVEHLGPLAAADQLQAGTIAQTAEHLGLLVAVNQGGP